MTAKVRVDFSQLALAEAKAKAFGASLKRSMDTGPLSAVEGGFRDMTGAMGDAEHQMGATGTAATQSAGGLGSMGVAGLILVGVAALLAAALAPVVAIVGAFTVGLLGAVSVLGLAVGGIGVFAAAAILIANATGKINGPMAEFQKTLKAAGDTLGGLLAPVAKDFLGVLNQLVPLAVQVAKPLIEGFQAMMPAILPVVRALGGTFLDALGRLGVVFEKFLGGALQQAPGLEKLFGIMATVGVDAINGLLTNLLALSQWFLDRLPTYGPIVGQIFSAIGSFVKGAASAFAGFTDWVVAHWPEISTVVGTVMNAVGQAIAAVTGFLRDHGAQIQAVANAFVNLLAPAIRTILAHSDALKIILIVVGAILLAAAAAIIVVVGAAILLAAGFLRAWDAVTTAAGGVKNFIGQAAGLAGSAIQGAIGAVEGAFNRVKNAVSGVLDFLGRMAGAIRNMPVIGGIVDALAGHRQHGGSVVPGGIYTVGETGPETLLMGRSGGYVLPGTSADRAAGEGAKWSVVFNISGAQNPAAVAAAVDARLSALLTQT